MNDKLLLARKAKKTIEYIIGITDNYPHKHIELKTRIINNCFDILELIYVSNIDSKHKKYIIPKLKMLDYYLKLSYKLNVITKKKYEFTSNYLLELVKMVLGWKSEENK